MRRLLVMASVCALALAKPEMYKESEDFQYSRSSSDEGSKSGFYGAQRGNMGGNYEKAHNMDGLAQHQMSSAVRQVEGELGDGAKAKSGSVYTAANSRGVFGSGHYDLSNLQGRNFEESQAFEDSLSHSSLTSQNSGHNGLAYQNSGFRGGYTKSSRHSSGYQTADYLDHHSNDYAQNQNSQAASLHQANNKYSYGGQAADRDYKYYTQDASGAQNQYEANINNLYSSNTYGRQGSDNPIRVVVRPGSIVTIPVSAQTYDASSQRVGSFNQNSINSDAEAVNSNSDSRIYIKPGTIQFNKPKHYESSYSYRNEWEKHNTQPAAGLPTENPFPKDSELYDDSVLLQNAKSQYNSLDSSRAHSSSENVNHLSSANVVQSNMYNANTKSSSANKSKYRYESQAQNSAAAQSNAYTLGTHTSDSADRLDANDLVENINAKPKSYHSSYSYHKSWERRGDPYVIKPVGGEADGLTSQKLVSASANQGAYSSHQYGQLFNRAHQSYSHNGVDCDENGHVRVARSPNPGYGGNTFSQQSPYENIEDLGQQTQNQWDNLESLGQQSQNQWDRLEELGQQTQNQWDKLEDLGQQTQNKWDTTQDLEQQSQDKLEFGQEMQNIQNLRETDLSDFQQSQQNIGQLNNNDLENFEQINEQSPRETQQQTQDNLDFTQNGHKDMYDVPTINLFQGVEKQKHNSGELFWNQKHVDTEDTYKMYDQKEIASENFDSQIQQQLALQEQLLATMSDILRKNHPKDYNDSPYYVKPITDTAEDKNVYQHNQYINLNNQNGGFSEQRYHHWDNNNDMGMSSWQHRYHSSSSPLDGFWNKLDNLDNQGGFKIDSNGNENDGNSYFNNDSNQSKWEQNNDDDRAIDLIHSDRESSTNLWKKQTSTISSTTTNTERATTTNKPTTHFKPITPLKPGDVGRGDIGADESIISDDEDIATIYSHTTPKNRYKTPDEIESLSLTKPLSITNNKKDSGENEDIRSNEEIINEIFLKHEPIVEQIEKTSPKPVDNKDAFYQNNPNTANFLLHNVVQDKQANREISGHNVQEVEQYPFEMDMQNKDQDLESFDLGQQIQGSWEPIQKSNQEIEDISQFSQNTWQPSNNKQSEGQELENFSNYKDNDNQQVQNLEQQFEHYGQANDNQEVQDLGQQFEHYGQTNDNQEVQNLGQQSSIMAN
ncbi:unnamed protein product [Leptosia nina]|uniref:Uncharacterized protein n=1 Tax=Leptosia nina TaxID=320188 RepID=A0AAV1K198_9NEOP